MWKLIDVGIWQVAVQSKKMIESGDHFWRIVLSPCGGFNIYIMHIDEKGNWRQDQFATGVETKQEVNKIIKETEEETENVFSKSFSLIFYSVILILLMLSPMIFLYTRSFQNE